ncbi:MAG: hypothetical protein LBN93_07260 [Candidatus Symbiothrix sp.]|jgi:hypothetical protein|nr:hypothetical protein [Candidatus Symbiothrix sp.]
MKNIAAHHIVMPSGEVFDMHYVALDDNNCLIGIFPLEKEIANTEFHNGTIRVVLLDDGRVALR